MTVRLSVAPARPPENDRRVVSTEGIGSPDCSTTPFAELLFHVTVSSRGVGRA